MPVIVVGVPAIAATMQRVWTVSGEVAMSNVIPFRSPVRSTVTAFAGYVTRAPHCAERVEEPAGRPAPIPGARFFTVILPPQIAAMAKKYEADE